MFRTHTNGELSLQNINQNVTLSGWVQTIRDKGFMMWIDLRDRYGITQLVFDQDRSSIELMENAKKLGREFVIKVEGKVIERTSKNPNTHKRGAFSSKYQPKFQFPRWEYSDFY